MTLLRKTKLNPSTKPMARSPMNRRSAKKAKQLRARKPLFEEVKAERGDICELKFVQNCQNKAECFHHVKKQAQGGGDDDLELLKLSCFVCNNAVENEPERARAAGLVMRRSDNDPVTPSALLRHTKDGGSQ